MGSSAKASHGSFSCSVERSWVFGGVSLRGGTRSQRTLALAPSGCPCPSKDDSFGLCREVGEEGASRGSEEVVGTGLLFVLVARARPGLLTSESAHPRLGSPR